MLVSLHRSFVFAFASVVAFGLFLIGAYYPLNARVRGDAYGYLTIADSFTGFASAFNYAGDRTSGLPLFEYAIHQALSILSPTVYLLSWINAIGIAMLVIHLVAAWLFAMWARGACLIQSRTACYLLFIFFATFPPLVGHTTTPLSDTLAIDLILLGVSSLAHALTAQRARTCLLFSGIAAACFGFSILVRPGSLLGIGTALLASFGLSFWRSNTSRVALGTTILGCLILLAPQGIHCAQKYGSVCLQSPKTFNANVSMQEGLRGARLMWSQKNEFPGTLPMVTDDTMFYRYYKQCRIESLAGFGDTSMTGCLLSRPLTTPAFVVKKWIGLFDYFRFTPYTENATPSWLRNLGRVYGALAWLGLCLCFVTLLKPREKGFQSNVRTSAVSNPGVVFLGIYSAVMLAQHTVLHTEERYGFALIPLCAAVLFRFCEQATGQYRQHGWHKLFPSMLFCCMALALFVVQIFVWDQVSFFAI